MDCCELLYILLFVEGSNWAYTLYKFKKEKEKN